MRLAKSVKVILGIVASSGAALVLSGSAFASDAGTGTTSETISNTTSQAVEGVTEQPKSVESPADVTTKSQDTKPGAAVSGAVTNVSGVSVAGAQQGVVGLPNKASDSALSPAPSKTVGSTTVSPVVASVPVKANPVVMTKVEVASSSEVVQAVVAPSLPAEPSGQSSHVTEPTPDVVFRSTMLPVQPKITNSRPLSAGDLASLVPSAPAQQQNPAKVPTPSQPTGLLTRLTSELAGIVVPQAFSSDVIAVVSVTARLLILFASILLLVGLMSVTFGSWMRRGGYAHAARSDVADILSSLFATPVRLGYVPAPLPLHSSFLMVSETKILS